MMTEKEKLQSLISLSMEFNQVRDLDILMEHILTRARTFANADAGSIYLKRGSKLQFSYAQNDTLQARLPLGDKLIYTSFEIPMDSNSLAGCVALSGQSLNIKDTKNIDPSLPCHFNPDFDKASGYWTHSILTIPLRTVREDIVGILQVINAKDEGNQHVSFSEEDEKNMALFAEMAAIALERARMTREMILRMIRMAEMRDPKETGPHVNRVAGFSVEIYESWAKSRGINRKEIDAQRDILRMAAMLHDVGKVSISDVILKKPGKLTEEEFDIMKQHSLAGARLFIDNSSEFDAAALDVALNHHERWDGKGYPGHVELVTGKLQAQYVRTGGQVSSKTGQEIPLFGRITAIADVFDALSSKRCYKEPWQEDQVLSELEKCKGLQFDPELIDHFFSSLQSIQRIQKQYQEET
jgi:response regulator RpfG family c-di-GMP phosphodiesterase